MARSITTIQNQIIAAIAANSTIAVLVNNTSKVAIWRLLTFVFAFAINIFEVLVKLHEKMTSEDDKRVIRDEITLLREKIKSDN